MNMSVNQSMNATNRLITDYFHIRKSTRKCKSDIERERREYVERAIKEQLEEGRLLNSKIRCFDCKNISDLDIEYISLKLKKILKWWDKMPIKENNLASLFKTKHAYFMLKIL